MMVEREVPCFAEGEDPYQDDEAFRKVEEVPLEIANLNDDEFRREAPFQEQDNFEGVQDWEASRVQVP